MHTSIIAGLLAAALALSAPLHGQEVAVNVALRTGAVSGQVAITNGYSTYTRTPVVYRRALRRVIVVDQDAPRLIVVEPLRGRGRLRHWREHGFRPVTVYYADGGYYDRYVPGWTGLRRVVVLEREGRFYQPAGWRGSPGEDRWIDNYHDCDD